MIVVVAEKPSVGRDIARVLGARETGEGLLRGGEYTVTWAVGHLCALCEPGEANAAWKRWRMEDLPMLPARMPVKVLPKTKKQFDIVKKLICAKDTARVICATDAGREGEYIFRLIYEQAGCDKPVQRLWISSMTDEAIRAGFAALRPAEDYDRLYRSAACRAQADWLVGMNASRAYSMAHNAHLSVGRVQTPTLAVLVQRRREIEAFTPEPYYTVTADFGSHQGLYQNPDAADAKTRARVPDKARADQIARETRGQTARVSEVARENKKEPAPQLFDLTTLQREANRALGFTAKKTLDVAQALYETRKAITYPRTDSRYLPPDMAARAAETMRCLPPPYDALARGAGELPAPERLRRVYDASKVGDHHAIIPTNKRAALSAFSQDEAALFDLIARRFTAAYYPPFEYAVTRVTTQCAGHAFLTEGRQTLSPGWRACEPAARSDTALPELAVGDERAVKGTRVKRESTKPPAPHTDASLLSAMENAGGQMQDEQLRAQMRGAGLGTPATRAAIIERLVQVGYAARKSKTIVATDKGVALISVAPDALKSPETTGRWELALTEIAQGTREPERFMEGIGRLCAFLVDDARTHAGSGQIEPEAPRAGRGKKKPAALPGVRCPLCGGAITENSKAFGCANWQTGCPFTLWKNAVEPMGPALTARIVTLLLTQGEARGSTGTLRLTGTRPVFEPAPRAVPPGTKE